MGLHNRNKKIQLDLYNGNVILQVAHTNDHV